MAPSVQGLRRVLALGVRVAETTLSKTTSSASSSGVGGVGGVVIFPSATLAKDARWLCTSSGGGDDGTGGENEAGRATSARENHNNSNKEDKDKDKERQGEGRASQRLRRKGEGGYLHGRQYLSQRRDSKTTYETNQETGEGVASRPPYSGRGGSKGGKGGGGRKFGGKAMSSRGRGTSNALGSSFALRILGEPLGSSNHQDHGGSSGARMSQEKVRRGGEGEGHFGASSPRKPMRKPIPDEGDEQYQKRRKRREMAIAKAREARENELDRSKGRSAQVKRSNRLRRRRGDKEDDFEDYLSQDYDFEAEEAARLAERMENMDIMLEFLKKERPIEYNDLTEKERHELEENLVVDILSQFHPNISVEFERDTDRLVAESTSVVEDAEDSEKKEREKYAPLEALEGDFIEEYKESFMGLLGVESEDDWKAISEGAIEDIRNSKKLLRKRFPHLVFTDEMRKNPGKVAEEKELDEMQNFVSSDDPLKDHMVKAMTLLKNNAGWQHQDRKRYLQELIERT